MTVPFLLVHCSFFFVLGCGLSFLGGFQYLPVNGCSTASCNFGALAGGDEHTSFHSPFLNQMSVVGLDFHIHPWLWPIPRSSCCRLSPFRQPESSPQVWPLKPEFQHSAPPCTSGHRPEAEHTAMAQTIWAGLCFACCKPTAALSSKPLQRPICPALSWVLFKFIILKSQERIY